MAESIEVAIERILGRKMTPEESLTWSKLRDEYHYSDDDPIAVVLALIGAYKIMAEALPGTLQKEVKQTLELHQQTLREQSTLVAKELVASVSEMVLAKVAERGEPAGMKWMRLAIAAMSGALAASIIFSFAR